MTQKEMITNDKIGSATVFQHEDTVLKTAAQFFAEELIPYLGIDGKVVSSAPTESIVLNLKNSMKISISSWKMVRGNTLNFRVRMKGFPV